MSASLVRLVQVAQEVTQDVNLTRYSRENMSCMNREKIIDKFNDIKWPFAPYDDSARAEMAERIARTGRLGTSLISYSNLVAGITFKLPTVSGGEVLRVEPSTL